MTERVPDTDLIRRRAAEPLHESFDLRKRIVKNRAQEFDAWLEARDQEMFLKGKAAGWNEGAEFVDPTGFWHYGIRHQNPYLSSEPATEVAS